MNDQIEIKNLSRAQKDQLKLDRALKNRLVLSVDNSLNDSNTVLEEAHRTMAYASAIIEEELKDPLPNESKCRIATRLVDSLKSLTKSVLTQRQVMLDESINLHSPKMKMIFSFFMDEVAKSFEECNLGDEPQELFFRVLSNRLEGWEDIVEKQMKKFSPTKLIEGSINE
jgi:hypothetical protein